MITLEDLTGIPKEKKKQIIRCLDELLTYRDADGNLSPIISGYNFYNQLARSDRLVTFSHMHETEDYKNAMLNDLENLGYKTEHIISKIRERGTNHLWDPNYELRDSSGNLFPSRIIDMRIGHFIDLDKYQIKLSIYSEFNNAKGWLISEDNKGWELNLPFSNKRELITFTELFCSKSRKYNQSSWTDAYHIPVILLGERAIKYFASLKQFVKATRFYLAEDNNEISFVLHRNLNLLKRLPHYRRLTDFGFAEELCLANYAFIENIDTFK